ncbi:ATP-binding protein [Bosea sp. CCNWLW174]|uniref:ATP-binding protein n=1 Tax=unclassified Bosea (in: a-proteobacteria) TaxID=2653178 RepID=UPI003015853B
MSIVSAAKTRSLLSSREPDGAESHEIHDIVVGKDVLELVSSAMYVDPMTVYREYIQNAADAIDAARAEGILNPEEAGRVDISVTPETRTVRIRDNGAGIAFPEFGRRLTALGGSAKRGTTARGFRGVGRLAGLGYAQELIFRSRVAGEEKVSQLRWDCRRLKAALREADADAGVADLIRSVIQLERIDMPDAPARFFEVELKGMVRLRNDRLMSPSAIEDYLSQVAPVPFSPSFRFADEITDALRDVVDLGSLEIWVEGSDAPIYRPYRDRFSFDDKPDISFDELDLIKIPGIDGDLAAIAWVVHHDYEGALPTATLAKGLRLRSGNVQVGDHTLLEELFPEPRFNVWSVGEVHVIDKRIVPNGRRDHFEQNAHYNNLTNQLAPTARDIARRCRTSSVRRKWQREFELQAESVAGTIEVIAQGGVGKSERERLALVAEQGLMQLSKIDGMEILAETCSARSGLVGELKSKLSLIMKDEGTVSSPLMRLSETERKTYESFFELIYQCSVNRVAAKALIDRIMMRLG